jgi:hypothetical protein
MALIVPIAIGNGVAACCCLSQLCLVPMLALSSQLGFLIVKYYSSGIIIGLIPFFLLLYQAIDQSI